MISKRLTIAAAIVLLAGIGAGQALAQAAPAATPQTTQATPAATPPVATPPAATPPAATTPDAGAVTPPAVKPHEQENPYGFGHLWANGDFVTRGIIIILGIMSAGTWYIFFVKMFEQSRMLGQGKQVERRFWSSANLNEGIDNLAKNSVFRSVAEGGVRASQATAPGIGNLNDWIGMSLNRQLEEINGRLQGGIAFLASVGSTAPFVGLFGTVWGILKALVAIGVSGNPSIEKVAGPVGEALIMTAFGLFTAVPAVLLYNFLVRRNKVINEKLRSFASDLQTYLVINKK